MAVDQISGVYRILCVPTGKVYIGSSKNIYSRFKGHRRELRRGTHHSSKLQRAWNKYGEISFDFNLLEKVDNINSLRDIEQLYIDKYVSYKNGFNIASRSTGPENVKRKCGDQSCRAKLSKEMVLKARDMFKSGISLRKIGRVFNIASTTIGRALRSPYWKNYIKEDINTKRYYRGEQTSRAKMKAQDVINLYQKYTSGVTVLELKKEYNIATSSIRAILTGRSWKCLGLATKERTSRITKQHVKEMYNIYKSNIYTKKEIGVFYNLHERSVDRLIKPLLEEHSV
jgi:group I intron endonuclease